MIIVCSSCQARYKFDESKLGDRPKAKTRCAKCGSLDRDREPRGLGDDPAAGPAAPRPRRRRRSRRPRRAGAEPPRRPLGEGTMTGRDLHRSGMLELPKDKRFSLAVIQGGATGQIFQINKTRTTIGRTGADINIDDPEASRQHAVVEILGEHAILRDLGSTNGTFIDIDRIDQQILTNQMEFRIGSHVLMFIVTDVE